MFFTNARRACSSARVDSLSHARLCLRPSRKTDQICLVCEERTYVDGSELENGDRCALGVGAPKKNACCRRFKACSNAQQCVVFVVCGFAVDDCLIFHEQRFRIILHTCGFLRYVIKHICLLPLRSHRLFLAHHPAFTRLWCFDTRSIVATLYHYISGGSRPHKTLFIGENMTRAPPLQTPPNTCAPVLLRWFCSVWFNM